MLVELPLGDLPSRLWGHCGQPRPTVLPQPQWVLIRQSAVSLGTLRHCARLHNPWSLLADPASQSAYGEQFSERTTLPILAGAALAASGEWFRGTCAECKQREQSEAREVVQVRDVLRPRCVSEDERECICIYSGAVLTGHANGLEMKDKTRDA
ncbi:uncharacterized protein [Symphalangus syndactylus]|uniref:uncharacterized protein isoform X1 n=1 Tax=Symphalangus syndactylus TaxID=9590 RepID=UPI003004939E